MPDETTARIISGILVLTIATIICLLLQPPSKGPPAVSDTEI